MLQYQEMSKLLLMLLCLLFQLYRSGFLKKDQNHSTPNSLRSENLKNIRLEEGCLSGVHF